MLEMTRESADRAATQVAEAARDMNLTAKDLLDHLDAVGGLGGVLVLLSVLSLPEDEPLDSDGVVLLARDLREYEEVRRVPPSLTGVEIGADRDSPPFSESALDAPVEECRRRHAELWMASGHSPRKWYEMASLHLDAGLGVLGLAISVNGLRRLARAKSGAPGPLAADGETPGAPPRVLP